jgi:hypothetical protein
VDAALLLKFIFALKVLFYGWKFFPQYGHKLASIGIGRPQFGHIRPVAALPIGGRIASHTTITIMKPIKLPKSDATINSITQRAPDLPLFSASL